MTEYADRPRLRPPTLPWRKRFGRAVVLLATFVMVPYAVCRLLGPAGAGEAAAVGSVIVLASAMTNGRRATRYAAPLMFLALVLGAWTKPDWSWVLVVAGFAFVSGMATMVGAGVATSMATLWAAIAPPFPDTGRLLTLSAYLVAGGVYGFLLARRAGAPEATPAPRVGRQRAIAIAASLAVAAAIATSIAVATGWSHATWIVVAVVVLGIPTPGITVRLMGQRMVGQLAACTAVTVVSLLADDPLVFMACALVAVVLYLMALGRPVYEQVGYLSAAIMFPIAAHSNGTLVAAERLGDNLLGLGILALVLAALQLVPDRDSPFHALPAAPG